ncbi:MAG: RNA polymerase sigma factor [Thalassospira sp.]|uniref:RNA polymerase sigma factor n=1 Tax=Thalassospira sp. TaxID=1912094 RepID=UPI003A89E265
MKKPIWWRFLNQRDSELFEDGIQKIWHLILEGSEISNCEVYFWQFIQDRLKEWRRQLEKEAQRYPTMDAFIDDESEPPFIEGVADENGTSPEARAIHQERVQHAWLRLSELSDKEQAAYFLREVAELKWQDVAVRMGHSIPTVKKYHKLAQQAVALDQRKPA